MVLKERIFKSFYSREGVADLERTDLNSCNFRRGVVILKELICNSFYFGWVWWP